MVFADECGLTEKPHRIRTWSRRGQTPVLQYHFRWKNLSAIAGITMFNFFFRLYPGAIRTPQIIQFLDHLLRHIPGRILLIWDRLPGHRSRIVREFAENSQGRLIIDFLPAYAPELNPTEYIWGYLKHHAIPNFCPKNFDQLKSRARQSLGNMRRRPALVTSFWKQAELPY